VIAVEILGAEAVRERLEAVPGAVEEGLARALARLSLELQARVQGKLSGEVLQSRNGALRASIEASLDVSGDALSLSLGSDLPYAGFQEYGFDGVESVRAQLRTIREAFGRPLRGGAREIAVRAHSRKVDYPAHSFLRSALTEMEPEIRAGLEEAVVAAVAS